MLKRLRNKVALIAGADAIGLAAAKRFEAEGAEVIVKAGDSIDEKLFATLGRKHGRLDILLLNAAAMAVSDLGLALQYAIPILSPGAAVIVSDSTEAFMHDAARELAGRNVRVHGISLRKSAEDVASVAAEMARA